MRDDDLIARFVALCQEQYVAWETFQFSRHNSAVSKLSKVFKKILKKEGLISHLLENEDGNVRGWAACMVPKSSHLFDEAMTVLERLESLPDKQISERSAAQRSLIMRPGSRSTFDE